MTNNQITLPIEKIVLEKIKPSALRQIVAPITQVIRLVFLFAYATLPIWATWTASQLGLYEVSSVDLLIAMAWMPISGAIIVLSFMKFGRKHKVKGTLSFILYNAIALTGIVTWIYQAL